MRKISFGASLAASGAYIATFTTKLMASLGRIWQGPSATSALTAEMLSMRAKPASAASRSSLTPSRADEWTYVPPIALIDDIIRVTAGIRDKWSFNPAYARRLEAELVALRYYRNAIAPEEKSQTFRRCLTCGLEDGACGQC